MSDLKKLLLDAADALRDYERDGLAAKLELAAYELVMLPKFREEKSYLTDFEFGIVTGWNYCVEEMMDVIGGES
jgi:hypothetical protein